MEEFCLFVMDIAHRYTALQFQLSAFFAGNVEFFCQPVGHRTRGGSQVGERGPGVRCHPSVNDFRQRAAEYLRLLNRVSGFI